MTTPEADLQADPIRAWRHNTVQTNPSRNQAWFVPATARGLTYGIEEDARCLHRSDHIAPDWNCSCGFHAWAERSDAEAYTWQISSGRATALIEVELSGRVIVHADVDADGGERIEGYRAQHQTVVAVSFLKICDCGAPAGILGQNIQGHPHSLVRGLCLTCASSPFEMVFTPATLAGWLGTEVGWLAEGNGLEQLKTAELADEEYRRLLRAARNGDDTALQTLYQTASAARVTNDLQYGHKSTLTRFAETAPAHWLPTLAATGPELARLVIPRLAHQDLVLTVKRLLVAHSWKTNKAEMALVQIPAQEVDSLADSLSDTELADLGAVFVKRHRPKLVKALEKSGDRGRLAVVAGYALHGPAKKETADVVTEVKTAAEAELVKAARAGFLVPLARPENGRRDIETLVDSLDRVSLLTDRKYLRTHWINREPMKGKLASISSPLDRQRICTVLLDIHSPEQLVSLFEPETLLAAAVDGLVQNLQTGSWSQRRLLGRHVARTGTSGTEMLSVLHELGILTDEDYTDMTQR